MSDTEQYAPRRSQEIGVLNAPEFNVIAEHELQRSKRDGAFLSLLWLHPERRGPIPLEAPKIDRRAVRGLADLLAVELRASDVVALLGDGDLVVLLPDTSPEQVSVVIEHLHATLLELAEEDRTALAARVGAATAAPGDLSIDLRTLLERAHADLRVALV